MHHVNQAAQAVGRRKEFLRESSGNCCSSRFPGRPPLAEMLSHAQLFSANFMTCGLTSAGTRKRAARPGQSHSRRGLLSPP